MKQKTKRAFDTVCELAGDSGLVGFALKRLAALTAPLGPVQVPDWLLREADRWDNPWRFLLGVRDLPEGFPLLFAAADSQRGAMLRFSRKAQKTGSLNTSCYDKLLAAIKSGNRRAGRVAEKKILGGMYRIDRGRYLLAAAKKSPELQAEIQGLIDGCYQRDVRRLGRRKADEKPGRLTIGDCFREHIACDRIAFAMTCGWLRGGKTGLPGLCFWSDEVIATYLGRVLNLRTLGVGTVRKLRHRLKLKKASVLVRQICPGVKGEFELLDSHGKAIWRGKVIDSSGSVILMPGKRPVSPPDLSHFKEMTLAQCESC